MARRLSKIQMKKEKDRNRYSIEIPKNLMEWANWKQGDLIDFSPIQVEKNKSQITLINTRLAKGSNPSLDFIRWSYLQGNLLNKSIKGMRKGRRKDIFDKKIQLTQEQLQEDIKSDNVPKEIGVYQSTYDKKLKIYPKGTILVKDKISGLEKRKAYFKMETKEINKQLKNLRRLKGKEMPAPSPVDLSIKGIKAK